MSIPGSGPVFLSEITCDSTDTKLLDCSRTATLGLITCEHDHDVMIHCEGVRTCYIMHNLTVELVNILQL